MNDGNDNGNTKEAKAASASDANRALLDSARTQRDQLDREAHEDAAKLPDKFYRPTLSASTPRLKRAVQGVEEPAPVTSTWDQERPKPAWYKSAEMREQPGEGQWKELEGIQDVPLGQVNLGDSRVQDAGDFHKSSYAEMREGVKKLDQTVMPAVHKGADVDYFSTLDKQRNLDYEHGYRRVYDTYYGSKPIDLLKKGDSYQVGNDGYHRLKAASEEGLKTVPAHVTELVSGE